MRGLRSNSEGINPGHIGLMCIYGIWILHPAAVSERIERPVSLHLSYLVELQSTLDKMGSRIHRECLKVLHTNQPLSVVGLGALNTDV